MSASLTSISAVTRSVFSRPGDVTETMIAETEQMNSIVKKQILPAPAGSLFCL